MIVGCKNFISGGVCCIFEYEYIYSTEMGTRAEETEWPVVDIFNHLDVVNYRFMLFCEIPDNELLQFYAPGKQQTGDAINYSLSDSLRLILYPRVGIVEFPAKFPAEALVYWFHRVVDIKSMFPGFLHKQQI